MIPSEFQYFAPTTVDEAVGLLQQHGDEAKLLAGGHSLLPAMKRISPECDITIEEIFDTPALDERGNTYLAQAIMPLCGHFTPGRVSFGTEAGILQDIGVPTVVCGPGRIAVAHQPDEYVELEQLEACMRFLGVLAERLEQGIALAG